MISGFLQGGLGNQLFILFATIAYAIQNKQPILFYYSEKLTNGCTLRYTYWDTFLSSIKGLTTVQPITNGIKMIKEQTEGKYNELDKVSGSAILYGYFQSYKYFNEEYAEISHMIGISDMRDKYCEWFRMNGLDKSKTISMHFRIGDYKSLNIPTLPLTYYINCLTYIVTTLNIPDLTILYFCEKENVEEVNLQITEIQSQFGNCKFKYCNILNQSTNQPTEQSNRPHQIIGIPEDEMIIMSICKYNIIANSTFSWWSAYIGYMEDLDTHIVCYPSITNPDLYPESWKKIEYI